MAWSSAGASWAQSDEFSVNSYGTGIQQRPQVATFSDGGFVVVWQSNQSPGDDSDGSSILGRRFDASASPLGDDFQVNVDTAFSQTLAQVQALSDDGFVVVWNTANSPLFALGETGDVKGRVFSSSGDPVATEFQVNTPGDIVTNYGHEVVADDSGGFAVVWDDFDGDVFLRTYGADVAPATAPILLTTPGPCTTIWSDIAVVGGSVYLPVWHCVGSASDIFLQRYGGDGQPVAPLQTAAPADLMQVVSAGDGFALARKAFNGPRWTGELFDAAGAAAGAEFDLSSELQVITEGPAGLATVWADNQPAGSDDDRLSIKIGRFTSDGATLSGAAQVNQFTVNDQRQPHVAALADGRFITVWSSRFSDDVDNDWVIRARILRDDVFDDG
ncbi:MAG: hypothetical protein AAFY88_14780, partial [Acidobacteriota bacterium]